MNTGSGPSPTPPPPSPNQTALPADAKRAAGPGRVAFNDHFSDVAQAYAQARPAYPAALFDALAAVVPRSATVWEPGCGSGQATRGLAARFAKVHATDPSAEQITRHWAAATVQFGIDHAEGAGQLARDLRLPAASTRALPRPGTRRIEGGPDVTLAVEPAERTVLPAASVHLVAVAQALHWFQRDAFFTECDRVLVPGGVLAAWGYQDFVAPEGMVDAVAEFRAQIEPHWPPERAQIDARYAGYLWPFPALPAPDLWLEAEWTLGHFMRYLTSMSASARCLAQTGDDPVARHAPALAAVWGDPDASRTLQWPLFVHLRRKPEAHGECSQD